MCNENLTSPPVQSGGEHAPTLLSYQERLIWLLGDLMNAAENYFGAINPKRLGHINCSAARIIDEVIDPSVATLAVALTEANQKNTTLTQDLAEAREEVRRWYKASFDDLVEAQRLRAALAEADKLIEPLRGWQTNKTHGIAAR